MKTVNQNSFPIIIGLLLSTLLFWSCEEKKIEYFDLNMVFYGPLVQDQIGEDDHLPSKYSLLMNYYEDTIGKNKIFVPKVNIERRDFDPVKKVKYEVPLSGLNNFRKSLDMLAAANLMEDYDNIIDEIVTPGVLIEPKGNIPDSPAIEGMNNTIRINLNTYNNESFKSIRNAIKDSLNKREASEKINLIFYTPVSVPATLTVIDTLSENGNTSDIVDTPAQEAPVVSVQPQPQGQIHGTRKFANGDEYVGELLNGIPHGWGKMTYRNARQISESDVNREKVEAGDYLEGIWVSGEFSSGKRYDQSDNYIKTIIIGSE